VTTSGTAAIGQLSQMWDDTAMNLQQRSAALRAPSFAMRRADRADSRFVNVRPRTPDDLASLVNVGHRVRAVDGYPVYLPGDDYARFLSEPEPIAAWVVEDDEGLGGHVALNPSASAAVTSTVRSAGIRPPSICPTGDASRCSSFEDRTRNPRPALPLPREC